MDSLNGRRPRVTVHYAQTLDGRIATRTGESKWVSCEASLKLAHQLRAEHDAVMVGVGTIVADNPHLTVRLASGISPRRVVADSTLRLPVDANVLTDGEAGTLIATTTRAPDDRIRIVSRAGAEVVVLGQDGTGRVNLNDLLAYLAKLDLSSILIEGGRSLITSALREHLIDRLVVCIAPKIIGEGIEAVGDLNILYMSEALTFERATFTPLDEDMIFDGQIDSRHSK